MATSKSGPSEAFNRALDAVEQSRGGLISHNICVGTRRTSLRLDALTWRALQEIVRREGVTLHELCTAIKSEKPRTLSLTVAIRLAVLHYYIDTATEAEHGNKVH